MYQVAAVTGTPMESLRKAVIGSAAMQLLLVGEASDFASMRALLNRSGDVQVDLDHALSTEEALTRMGQSAYDLLLCEYKSGDGAGLRLLHELRRNHPRAPVIFLSDHMDEDAVDTALKAALESFLTSRGSMGQISLERSVTRSTSIARSGNSRSPRTRSANYGAPWSNPRTWS